MSSYDIYLTSNLPGDNDLPDDVTEQEYEDYLTQGALEKEEERRGRE